MLNHLNEKEAARKLETAVKDVVRSGKDVTYDLKKNREDSTAVGTQEMADAICRRVKEL